MQMQVLELTYTLLIQTEFGGRARWGATFGGYPDVDDNGHGTHCAGTAASTTYGVAKQANIIAVKVLDHTGHGNDSDLIFGLEYIQKSAKASGRPSIASLSLISEHASKPIDDAIASLTKANIIVVVIAGNNATDARRFSPARAPSAITVGASDIADEQASFSNYGPAVDILAPGVNIISTWIGNINVVSETTQATKIETGTSMAVPHISGLAATFLTFGKFTPAAMKEYLAYLALK
ncbi:hypothetical protein C0995_016236, partial [Termitomyces sp. Mi166